jgi:hypothetical protein
MKIIAILVEVGLSWHYQRATTGTYQRATTGTLFLSTTNAGVHERLEGKVDKCMSFWFIWMISVLSQLSCFRIEFRQNS